MGLFSRIKQKERIEQGIAEYFKVVNAYTPAFTSFEGGIYEMELTRACINSFATHISKMKPVVKGSNNTTIERMLQYHPNGLMNTSQYLARLATVFKVYNTAYIAPLEDSRGNLVGFYPLDTSKCRLVKSESGVPYIQYELSMGDKGAIEFERVGRMVQMQLHNEIAGENNNSFAPTLELIHANNQNIVEGMKTAATVRFMAQLSQTLRPEDIEAERKRFVTANLTHDNGGVLLFDQKYSDVKQVTSNPYTVDEAQLKRIKENCFEYFGTNENILQNKFTSSEWNAYYEGQIEPFAVQAGLVHTGMLFGDHEIAYGNEVMFTSNRLQYMSAAEKTSFTTSLFDRGVLNQDEIREIFNLEPLNTDESKKYYIRREYIESDKLGNLDLADTSDPSKTMPKPEKEPEQTEEGATE